MSQLEIKENIEMEFEDLYSEDQINNQKVSKNYCVYRSSTLDQHHDDQYAIPKSFLLNEYIKENVIPSENQDNCQSSQKYEFKEDNQLSACEKILQKSKKLRKKRSRKVVGIQKIINVDEVIRVQHGITISKEGIIRFQQSVSELSFGFDTHDIHQVTYLKNNQLIQIIMSQSQLPRKFTLEKALTYLAHHTPQKMYHQAQAALKQFINLRDQVYDFIKGIQIDEAFIDYQEREMALFLEISLEFMYEYNDQQTSEIFSYVIGRMNIFKTDLEVKNHGFSKSFLDLIGIDVENFSAIQFRKQKIDLISDEYEIMEQSIFGMNLRFSVGQVITMKYNITTFDGFPLKIQTSRRVCLPPGFQYSQFIENKSQYFIQITTFDIDLLELKNLIQYREKLLSNKNQLTFDEFIKKELSYQFENVEYSVHSQLFIQKYYEQNVINLQNLESSKIKQQNSSIQIKNNSNITYID